jgi:signal transduction histidine kinase
VTKRVATRASRRIHTPPGDGRSLRVKLDEAEETLAAIRAGDVDAVVVEGPLGERVFTLEGAEHGYRVLMEALSEGVATLNPQGIVSYCNPRFSAILHARQDLTVGNTIFRLVPEVDRARFAALIAAGTWGRSEGEFWLKAPCADEPALVRLAVVALNADGARTHCLVMTDLTEPYRQSTAMAAERTLMRARLALAERMSSLGTLAAGVAHEINNPLAYVLTSIELMKYQLSKPANTAPGPSAEATSGLLRQVNRAQEGAERVRVIVRDLKAFSSADNDTVGIIDPRRALDTSIALASNEIRHRARLVQDYDELPRIRGNEARLGQVFLNLLVNATQAIPSGAAADHEIRVTGHADAEGHAVIDIRDTGSGIDAAHMPFIFDPFFTTKPPNEGTGLGLSLCHAIITSLEGHITAESKPGAGSVFRIVLPGVEGAVPSIRPPSIPPPGADPRGRLLVIDDEEDLCLALQEAVEPAHDIVTTTDAHRGLEMLASGQRFDLILCDIRMPQMTRPVESRSRQAHGQWADRKR